jgi:Domain of unknown function (DUF5916)
MSNWLQIRNDTPNKWFRSRMINFNQYAGWNFDGDRLFSGGNVNAHATWVNNWEMGGGYNVNALEFDDRATRGGPGVYNGGFRTLWHYLNTDARRRLRLSYFIGGGSNGEGQTFFDFHPGITYRPLPALTINPGVRFSKNRYGAQWVEKVTDTADHYVFGELDQTTVVMTTRVNYTLSPTLSLELYAEPFVSAGDYGAFKELVDGRSRLFDDRYAAYDYHYAPATTPISTSNRSGRRTCCGGSTSRGRRSSSSGSRRARTTTSPAGSASAATCTTSSAWRRRTRSS